VLIDGTFIQAALDCKIHIRVCTTVHGHRCRLFRPALFFAPSSIQLCRQDGLKSQLDGTALPMTTRYTIHHMAYGAVPFTVASFRSCVLAELKRLGSRFTGAAVVAKRLQMCEVSTPAGAPLVHSMPVGVALLVYFGPRLQCEHSSAVPAAECIMALINKEGNPQKYFVASQVAFVGTLRMRKCGVQMNAHAWCVVGYVQDASIAYFARKQGCVPLYAPVRLGARFAAVLCFYFSFRSLQQNEYDAVAPCTARPWLHILLGLRAAGFM
jgi:hypothetical protein